MIRFTGDFEELKQFAKQIADAGRPSTMLQLNEQLAEETIGLIRDGFEDGEDPYGHAWAPLVVRDGRPLQDTGGLKASWHTEKVGTSEFTVASSKDYAVYHQGGTGIYGPRRTPIVPIRARALRIPGVGFRSSVKGTPRRRMFPDAGRIPTKWRRQLVTAALETLHEIFRET